MTFVDADSHVLETARAWRNLRPHEKRFEPPQGETRAVVNDRSSRFWLVEGRLAVRGGQWLDQIFPPGAPDLDDVPARVRHMDQLGIDVQVLIPTFFLNTIIEKPEVHLALARSYNRWMAEVWKESAGRLRWAIVAPMATMSEVRKELAFGREHGGVSVFSRGVELNRRMNDPYFDPLYKAAEELDLAISFHIGISINQVRDIGGFFGNAPVVDAYRALITSDVPERFPKLRFGFLEAGSMWVPSIIHAVSRTNPLGKRQHTGFDSDRVRNLPFYVACQYDEDIAFVAKYIGEDHLVIGTDYGHNDVSADLEIPRLLSGREDLTPSTVDAILNKNPRALYSL